MTQTPQTGAKIASPARPRSSTAALLQGSSGSALSAFLIFWRNSGKELEEGLVMNWFNSVYSLSRVRLFATP